VLRQFKPACYMFLTQSSFWTMWRTMPCNVRNEQYVFLLANNAYGIDTAIVLATAICQPQSETFPPSFTRLSVQITWWRGCWCSGFLTFNYKHSKGERFGMLTMPAPWLGFKYSYIQQCSKVRVLLYGLAPKGFGMRNMMPEESYNLQAIDIYYMPCLRNDAGLCIIVSLWKKL